MRNSAGRPIDDTKGAARGLRIGLGLMVVAVIAAALLPVAVKVGAVWRITDMPLIQLLMRLFEGVI